MRTLLPILVAVLLLSAWTTSSAGNTAPVVTNVVAQQIPGTGTVHVTYDVADAEGDSVYVTVVFEQRGFLPAFHVAGDTGHMVAPGYGKEVVWNAALDYPGRAFDGVIAHVTARDGVIVSGEMVLVPGGPFLRGTDGLPEESPASTVSVDSFYIDRFEVTVAEYAQFIDAGGYTNPAYWSIEGWAWRLANQIGEPRNWNNRDLQTMSEFPGYPAQGVSWYEAEAYARFVGKRLPTEAEWEKAARGVDGRRFPWGDSVSTQRANYGGGSPLRVHELPASTPCGYFNGDTYGTGDHTVNSPGPYGTYDQAGNVAEWCADYFDPNYYSIAPASNPLGPADTGTKVLRGGMMLSASEAVRCASRTSLAAGSQGYLIYYYGEPYSYGTGIRLARSTR